MIFLGFTRRCPSRYLSVTFLATAAAGFLPWLAAAAADRLRNGLLGATLDAWEAESMPFGDKELDAAARALGLSQRS